MFRTKICFVICVLVLRGSCYRQRSEDKEEERIVWGTEAEEGQFPFVAALHYKGRFICTASIICKEYLLTAAHCVMSDDDGALPAKDYTATLGHVHRSNQEYRVTFESIIPHENYDTMTIQNDIALMRLYSPINYTDNIKPICTSQPNETYDGQSGKAIGWGRNHIYQVPEKLHYADVDVSTLLHCRLAYRAVSLNRIEINRNHVCAGSRMKGVCNGDSGGPLMLTTDGGKIFTAGVTSFGSIFGCGAPGIPAVYTSTSQYNGWIIKNAKSCTPCVV